MAHYTLTVYRADDTTPWFEVSTDPAHTAPYLHEPGEVDAGEVDFLEGRATIGQVNLRVIDPQTGASQAERWLTERLGIPAGEEGEGHTALIGRRALLVRDGSTIVLDGVVYSVTLSESFAGFSLQLRDIRERERRSKLFTRTGGTATVLPRGVLAGYGRLPSGGWLIPPTTPLRATWRTVGSFFDFSALWIKGNGRGGDGIVPAQLAITEAMTRALRQVVEPGEPYEEEYAPGQFRTVYPYRVHYPDVQVLWRPVGTTPWRVIERPEGGPMQSGALVLKGPATVQATQGSPAVDVSAAWGICVSPNTPDLPSDGQAVEVLILYVGPPTEDFPLHVESTAGELLRAIYRGDYSDAPLGVRYDEPALLALTTPVRLRITEPVDDARRWIEEHIYRALGAAPALDPQGRVSPVRAALPDPDAVLPTIDDSSAAPIPGWSHSGADAVTVVRVTYPRDYRVPVEQDPTGERSAGDGIVSREVTIELRAPDWAIGLMGEQVHEIDASIFRALGGPEGEPVTGDVTDETGAQIALQRAHETIDRWLFGGQVSSCRIRAADFPGLRVGDWVIDARSWRPNYRTRTRGGSTLAQVMAIRASNPAWLDVTLVDAGPAEQPLQPPALDTLSVDGDGVVSVPVTSVPAGGEAAVYYAISATEPDSTSGLWTFLGRLGAPGVLETPPLPAGARVWVRARGEALGRRPSAYTAAVSVTVPQTPRVQNVRVVIENGVARALWDRNAYAAGVRIRYEIHDPATDPTLGTSIDVAASLGTAQIPGTVHHGQAVTVELEPWTGWTGSAVSGTAGPRIVASASRPAPTVLLPPTVALEPVSRDATKEVVRVVGTVGEGGTPPLEYRYRIDDVGALGTWSAWASLPNPLDLEIPHLKRWSRTVVAQVRDAGGRVSDVATYVVQAELPGLGPGGGIDPLTPYDDGSGRTPADTDNDARAGRRADTDLSDFEAGGWLNRTQRRIEAIYRPGVGALSGADLVAGGDSLTRLGDRHAANINRSAADPTPLSSITQHLGADGHALPTFKASDGAGPKLLPKGVMSGTVFHKHAVVFGDTYQDVPIIILIPSTSYEGRNRWGTIDEADNGSADDPMPTGAQIIQRVVAVATTSGFTAYCRLIARQNPQQRTAVFTSPQMLLAVGATSGPASLSADVPSYDDTYTAVFHVVITNNSPNDLAFVDVLVAVELSLNNGAYSEVQAVWFGAPVGPGQIAELFNQTITVGVVGIDPGPGGTQVDRFRLKLKDILIVGPSPQDIAVQVTAVQMRWHVDPGAKYASMTPGEDIDGVQFFVISQGGSQQS